MKAVHPYLNFPGNTEEAFEFYRSVFGGDFLGGIVRFSDVGDSMGKLPDADLDKVAHMGLSLGNGQMLMGTDALESLGQSVTFGNNFYVLLDVESAEEAQRLFDALSAGGTVEMPLEKTGWAELYGAFTDKFGVQWMVNYDLDPS